MKAISFAEFGPANQVLKVSDWPTPAPGPGEVLVKLQRTGLNPPWGAHFTDRRACFCLSSAIRALAWHGSRIRGDRYLTRT